MTYTLETLPDEPIVVFTQQMGDPVQDMIAVLPEITQILDAQAGKAFLIIDIRQGQASFGLDDIIQAASMTARGSNPLLHHPNVRETVYVASDSLIKMAIKGLSSVSFGQAKVAQFGTFEEALAHCRG